VTDKKGDVTGLFRRKAPGIMRKLIADFGLDVPSAAAILGNIGHECGGFRLMQELRPSVPGSRGGYGWCQWTGPRRRDFEAYCARNGKDMASDEANYAWLWVELSGSEKAAIPAVKRPGSLLEKVAAFEQKFERAGVKHYDKRLWWAQIAMAEFGQLPMQPDDPGPLPKEEEQGWVSWLWDKIRGQS
jgi:hypothetical protein